MGMGELLHALLGTFLTFPFKGQHAAQRLVAAKANIRIANVMPEPKAGMGMGVDFIARRRALISPSLSGGRLGWGWDDATAARAGNRRKSSKKLEKGVRAVYPEWSKTRFGISCWD